MDLGDLNKVWEIKPLKKPGEDEARKMLEKVVKQVQPIMRKRKWRVKVLREFCPVNPALLGLNVGGGVEVKLRLRRPNRDWDFIPYEQVLDTMLHELCHIEHGPHNASFYKLWDEIRKECEDLIARGVSGTGQGFDLPGKRLGGFSHAPPLPALRQAALAAAEKRARAGSLLPSGPKRLGGDSDIMVALSPIQAAAMAAERRMLDELWCGSNSLSKSAIDDDSGSSGNLELDESAERSKSSTLSGKSTVNSVPESESRVLKVQRIDPPSGPSSSSESSFRGRSVCSSSSGSSATHCATDITHNEAIWECCACTLFNPPLAPVCEACGAQKPKDTGSKFKFWSCKFCTLENSIKLDKCSACESWRYSHGPPVSTHGPYRGT